MPLLKLAIQAVAGLSESHAQPVTRNAGFFPSNLKTTLWLYMSLIYYIQYGYCHTRLRYGAAWQVLVLA